jgi:hypothetical protein
MADNGPARDIPAQPIGRIRVTEDIAPPTPEDATAAPEASGWSLAGVGIGALLVLLMVGAMVIILWAIFQARM